MPSISTIVFTLLMLAIAFTIGFMAYAMFQNMQQGHRFRNSLLEQVNRLRINRMLTALGIDINRYLHQESVLDIHNQLDKCQNCDNTEDCDADIAKGTATAENIDYCDNASDLRKIQRKQHTSSI